MIWNSILLVSIITVSSILCLRNDKKWKWIIILLIPLYIYCLMKFTIIGRVGSVNSKTMNLFPGESLLIMLSSPWNNKGGYEYIEAVGNVLLFVPFGMFLKKCLKCNYHVLAWVTLLISVLIEYTQLSLMIGIFEIDDVIHNMWGCFMGGNLVYLLKCLDNKKMPEKEYCDEIWAVILFLLFCALALVLYLRFILR